MCYYFGKKHVFQRNEFQNENTFMMSGENYKKMHLEEPEFYYIKLIYDYEPL